VEGMLSEEMFGSPELGGYLEHFSTGPLRLMVRLGQWDEILASPAPPDDRAYARAMWHYARGMAHAARGDTEAARGDLSRLLGAADQPGMGEMVIGFNTAEPVLRIAGGVLAGEIALRDGDHDGAITQLRAAAEMEDALTYGEPPDWPVPVRQYLGAALSEAGRYAEAETAYREDLARFPENGWSLHGLASTLRAQGRSAEADDVDRRLRSAWEDADVRLPIGR
jgi:tetratricopeptide (TPR) repeat protein